MPHISADQHTAVVVFFILFITAYGLAWWLGVGKKRWP